MTKHSDYIWLSVHLFYNEPWEEFLQQAVEPYVNTAIQTGIVQQYFFIRYWERGPHIRLRLKAEKELVKVVLEPNIKEHFETYFSSKPSVRKEPSYPVFFPDESKWFPNNSVQKIQYQPELERYGGPVGMEVAEEHFMLSSKTVLDLIMEKGKNWSYEEGMGSAIKLYVTLAGAAEFSIEEAIAFFDMVHLAWLPHALGIYQKQMSAEAIEQQTLLTLQTFEHSFEQQKEDLIPFHQELWNGIKEENSFEDEIMPPIILFLHDKYKYFQIIGSSMANVVRLYSFNQ